MLSALRLRRSEPVVSDSYSPKSLDSIALCLLGLKMDILYIKYTHFVTYNRKAIYRTPVRYNSASFASSLCVAVVSTPAQTGLYGTMP